MLLVFDLDGTLVSLPIDWKPVEEAIQRISGGATRFFLGFLANFYGSKEFWEIHQMVEELEMKAIDKLAVLDNAIEVVKRASTYFTVAIATMQSRRACISVLERLGLTSVVRTVITREDAGTRIDQLRKLLTRVGTAPEEAIFVGDKVLDAIAALMVGIKPILVLRDVKNPWFTPNDNILEDLEALRIPIARNLEEALGIALELSR